MILLALLSVVWIACGVLTFGIINADFWYQFPALQKPGYFRENARWTIIYGISGPFGLIVSFLLSEFAQYGLLFREPPKTDQSRLETK